MNGSRPLRIAMLAHSTNPRGGVVHALELADALARLGHIAAVHAPDANGNGFFRETVSKQICIQTSPTGNRVAELVESRIADYVSHFENPHNRRFDVFHAQDSISGNALAELKRRGVIDKFARTVHHIDEFRDGRLTNWQSRSIDEAHEIFVVSRHWKEKVERNLGRRATLVGNGVDTRRFTAAANGKEKALRMRWGLQDGPIILCVGGVEERKNTNRILEAFQQILSLHRTAQLVIAGGASLLNHDGYRRRFNEILSDKPQLEKSVILLNTVADEDMPTLYRLADVLAFPSIKEGFGLVVLEAMASSVPVVTSRIAPFTEYLTENDVVWCDPLSVGSIANAITMSLGEPLHSRLAQIGPQLAAQHDWTTTACAHLPVYERLRELQNA
jgi:glycosyltransferase-like protein